MRRDGHVLLRFRLVSWLMFYLPLLVVGAAALLAKGDVAKDDRFELAGIVVVALAVLCFGSILILAAKIDCPVCLGRVFGPARCSKHRDARRVLGSTRLGMVVRAVLAIDELRCRFCGTRLRSCGEEEGPPPTHNEIDELYSLQMRTGNKGRRQTRSVLGAMPALRQPVRPRRAEVPAPRKPLRARKGRVPQSR